jgi:transposase-like protein
MLVVTTTAKLTCIICAHNEAPRVADVLGVASVHPLLSEVIVALPTYRRRTREVDALIAGAYLAGTNTRRVGRALTAVFRGAISKSTVSRVWRQIKADWESWNRRDLKSEDIVRLILDGTVVKVRLDKKATSISLLVVLGVRRDGQKVLLAVKKHGRRERGCLARHSR